MSSPKEQTGPADGLDGQFEPNRQADLLDSKAEMEASAVADGRDLDQEAKEQEHRRHQTFRNHINWAILIVFWVLVGGFILGSSIYGWHVMSPEKCHFLAPAQLTELRAMLASAILSSALTGYASRRLQ